MNLEKLWLYTKKYALLSFLLPIFLVVAFDYLRALLLGGQLLLGIFITMQGLATIGGFVLGAVRHASPDNAWLQITELNLVKVFPTITLGEKVFTWAIRPQLIEHTDPGSAQEEQEEDYASQRSSDDANQDIPF